MRKKWIWGAVAVCLVVCFSSAAFGQSLVFNTQEFSPFSYDIEGRVSGPVAEIIETACQKSQLICSFRLLPWTRAQNEVSLGKAHALFVIGKNKEREEWLYFSPPILKTEYGFFVRTDDPLKYTDVSDMKGYKVGVYGPSNTSKKLEGLKEMSGGAFTIDLRPDDESGFRKLSIGRVTAVFSNKDAGFALIQKIKLDNLRYAGKQCELNYYIGFSKKYNDRAVVERFNETLLEMKKDGIIKDILSLSFMTPAD